MNSLKIRTIVALVALVVLALTFAEMVDTTGMIAGKVIDEKGEALPGAIVALDGTRLEASTDAEGFYEIASVDPAAYKMTASMVGYHSATRQQIQVRSDLPTTIDFQLREKELAMEELVVVTEAPTVEAD